MMQGQSGSATIYQFPVGGRDGLRAAQRPIANDTLPGGAAYAVGESWYHAEAVADAQRAKPQ